LDLQDIDTPALIIDLEAMERNIKTVAKFFQGKNCKIRLHTKSCKAPVIAHKVLEMGGTRGICVAKLSEAEMMATSGIHDILIANEVVGREKAKRLAKLSKWCDVKVAIDNPDNVEELAMAAQEEQTKIGALVDVNMSQFGKLDGLLNRCGVLPGKEAVSLGKKIASTRGLEFKGFMGYEGSMSKFANSFQKRREAVHEALKTLIETRDLARKEGLNVEIVSAGCTGTWNITGAYPGVTEVEAGSYVFMDVFHEYEGVELENALSVLATIVSTPYPGKAIADVGQKGMTMGGNGEMPKVKQIPNVKVERLNAEHTHLVLSNPSTKLRVGDKIELYPYSCDMLVNLYDKYYAVRKDEVEAEWDIPARGMSA